jgi:V8-like Glu-specific endopeptidase/uncharacterized membrane protein required for colicin V production
MFGFNWVDILIILILILAVIEGLRIGLLAQVFFIGGFFATLFASGWLFPYIIRFHNPTTRTTINIFLVLIVSFIVGYTCMYWGRRIHWSFRLGKLITHQNYKFVETILGSIPSLVAALILIWLLGVMISRMPFVGFSNSVSDSLIIRKLDEILPAVPEVFAEFDRSINPNAQPFVPIVPLHQTTFNYSSSEVNKAATSAAASVVRITSFSCNGIVAGSGFVIGKDLVATNAHVIAGSKRPIIKWAGRSYQAEPIYFNSNLDIAILLVKNLNAPALSLAKANVALDSSVAIVGYPDGNYDVQPGIIRGTRATSSANIYNLGSFNRGVYVIQANIDFGSSGSPVVVSSGQVVGIIFSKSTDSSNTAYALTSNYIYTALKRTSSHQQTVSTGACVLD